MKKLLSAAIAVTMALSPFASVVMAEDNEMTEILKTVKERIEIPAELEDFESSSYEDTDAGVTMYSFTWSSDDANISVECNDNKVITHYNFYRSESEKNTDSSPSFPQTDINELHEKAQNFVDKINPNLGIVVGDGVESLYNRGAHFPVSREKDTIEIVGNNGYINFDDENKEIQNFSISWSTIDEFEDDGVSELAMQTDSDAQKAFNEKLGFEVVYRSYIKDKEIIFYPAYVQKESRKYIDAVTGNIIEPEEQSYKYAGSGGSNDAAMAANESGIFTPNEIAELEKVNNLISKTDVENKVRENNIITVPEELKLVNISLSRNYYDDESYIYRLYFSNDKSQYCSASVDAVTGDIYSLNKNSTSSEQADEEIMINALNELAPSISKKYEFDGEKLSRYENGIKVESDNSSVFVDDDGKPISYNVNYTTKAEFPSVENIISNEDASLKIFEAVGYTKKYFPKSDKKAYLAYSFDNDINLNALTGKMVGYDNEEITDDSYTYSDISGHYAEEQIKKLAKFNIGFTGGQFKPDENITESEFENLMSSIFNRIVPINENAEEREKTKDNAITRETAAILMIRAMGAEDYAKYNDIYTQPFKDVTENKGYISLLSAMGVINGDDSGNFNPNKLLTRAEAAVMIYNYLNK